MQIDFTKKLLKWNQEQNFREMPWKKETDPYRIWLSEIILQQTRVEQGLAYYKKFLVAFPTIVALAQASEKEIFKCWEGLGYYSRCRNLIATAKKIAGEYQGRFPSDYQDILALPGIGPYTAAAISSFAFGLPHAVVDGNVERVLARYFGISTPAGTSMGKKLYSALAGELLDKKSPGNYNQAIMDFGATVCKPRNPLCSECIQAKNCQALQKGWTKELPTKRHASPRKKRWFYFFVVGAGKNKWWIRKRTEKDIWQNLYEFFLWETGKLIPQDRIREIPVFRNAFGKKGLNIRYISPPVHQLLTHQSITGYFIHLDNSLAELPGYESVSVKRLRDFPFPKMIADYMASQPGF
jgi:A/G-specific adenine glycosylase